MSSSLEHRLLEEVVGRHEAVGDAARAEALRAQRDAGKLTARQRVAALVDPGSFIETGALAEPARSTSHTMNIAAPADGVITGSARVDGRPVGIISFDFSVLGGSNGAVGGQKVNAVVKSCFTTGSPLVMLLDGGGHRIQEGLDARHFAHGFDFFALQAQLSGWVPMVAAVLGPGFAGPSNFAAMADFVVMNRATATMGVAGPALVRAATGEEIGKYELGGASVQTDLYGLADLAVGSDQEALDAIAHFLSYLPSNAGEDPPVIDAQDADDRREEWLADAVPANGRAAYDVLRIVTSLADSDSVFELKPTFARNVVTALGRMAGRPVGFIANQPSYLAGTLDASACEKAAHFISVCDAYGLALIYLIDVPGFLVGSEAERSGLGRRSGRMLYELGQATVPRMSVVLRKGYGLGYIAMCGGRSFDPELCVAWPTAEISAMSVEGAVDIAYRRELEADPDPSRRRQQLIDGFRSQLGALTAAQGFGIDDVIDPRDTRRILIEALRRSPLRRPPTPVSKVHGISPI
ncbi:MAG: acyl-CoA carboxylase [Actinobacteria bacterium]|nr:acyl-CoA carboxylase [Actinomycetota bacterium]